MPARETSTHSALYQELLNDLFTGFARLVEMPAAVSVLGSARTQPGDPAFDAVVALGHRLAHAGETIRTGAGPGAMEAAPLGYLEARDKVDPKARATAVQRLVPGTQAPKAADDDVRTQGGRIILPFEQITSPTIEHVHNFQEFAYRKLFLFANTTGCAHTPGGFGTLEELLEHWMMGIRNRHQDPIVAYSAGMPGFYESMFKTLDKVARQDRQLIDDQSWNMVSVTSEEDAAVKALTAGVVQGFDVPPDQLVEELVEDQERVFETLKKSPPSVTVLGADSLAADDPALAQIAAAADSIASKGRPLRISGSRAIAQVVSKAAAKHGQKAQAFTLKSDGIDDTAGLEVCAALHHEVGQKLALTRGTTALVVGPGDIEALGKLFSFLCEVQCKKVPPIPIVLVGSDYWTPLMASIKASLLDNGERAMISPEDLDLFTIVDTQEEILAAIGNTTPTPNSDGRTPTTKSSLSVRTSDV